MRNTTIVISGLVVIAGVWLWTATQPTNPLPTTASPTTTASRTTTTPTRSSSDTAAAAAADATAAKSPGDKPTGDPSLPATKSTRAKRDALRQQIVAAQAQRNPAPLPNTVPSPNETSPTPPGSLTDRSGNRGYLLRTMNEDLMPLADECYALARAQDPTLQGMLALNLEVLSDEELGGVVDTIDLAPANELKDPALLECVRESLLATTLPPPPHGGRDAFMLSLRLTPDEADSPPE